MPRRAIVFAIMAAWVGLLQGCVDAQANKANTGATREASANQRVAGLGDAVLSVETVAGSATAGRASTSGTTTFYFAGVSGAKAIFVKRDVFVQHGPNASGRIKRQGGSYFDGQGGAIPYSGVASVSAYPIVVPPNASSDRIVGVRDQKVAVSIGKTLVVSGKSLRVISAGANHITYEIQ